MRKLVHSRRWAGVLAGLALCVPGVLAGLSPAVAGAEACPNEALRTGLSANLPDCRAYEMVSPVEKNGGDVDSVQTVQSAPSGEAAAYASATSLPGSETSVSAGFIVAHRTPAGWVAKGLEAPQLNQTSLIFTTTEALSEDLSKSLVVSRVALAPGAVEGNGNVYLQNNETGARTLVGSSNNPGFFYGVTVNPDRLYQAGTPDLSHVVIGASVPLSPGLGVEGVSNLYDWSASSGSRLANVALDGSEDTTGARSVSGAREIHAISDDGSRLFYVSGNGVYLRSNGSSTRLISASQRTGDDPTVPRNGELVAASEDGSVVYFTSDEQLTNNASPTPSLVQLYRYEVGSGHLEAITRTSDPEGPRVLSVMQVSADGSYVYFTAWGALAAGAIANKTNLYVWHDGVTKLIGLFGTFDVAYTGFSSSPDGRWLAFTSSGSPTGYDNTSTACPGNFGSEFGTQPVCPEVYVYSADANQLTCVTCNPVGAPRGEAGLGSQDAAISGYSGRRMLDGGTLFFQSSEGLTSSDSNGKMDVYEWSPEAGIKLISPGTADQNALIEDVTPDGQNVFIRTRQQLVGQDTDESADLYDVRVDGGFPPPAKAQACSGTACQGVPPAPPIFATPPSVTFNGVGNFEAPKPTVKAKAKVKAKHKRTPKSKAKKKAKKKQAKKAGRSSQRSTRRGGREGGKG